MQCTYKLDLGNLFDRGYMSQTKNKLNNDEQFATSFKEFLNTKSPAASIMQMSIDIAADLVIANQADEKYPELLRFLVLAGTTEEEVIFKNFIQEKSEIMYCHTCKQGKLQGGCPILTCNKCGRKHYIIVDNITDNICNNCAARKMKECLPENVNKYHKIYVMDTENA